MHTVPKSDGTLLKFCSHFSLYGHIKTAGQRTVADKGYKETNKGTKAIKNNTSPATCGQSKMSDMSELVMACLRAAPHPIARAMDVRVCATVLAHTSQLPLFRS